MILSILMLVAMNGQAADTSEGYKFGVFPYLPTNRIKKVYAPIAKDFEKTIGQTVTMRTKRSYKDFRKALFREEYDIAFIQPYDYIEAHDKYNYLPMVRRKTPLQPVIIVKKDSKLKDLQELKGKVLATPSALSAVSKVTDQVLNKNGIDVKTEINRKYKKNHFACMQSVIIGEAAACGTALRALKHFGDVKMKDKFKILYQAKDMPNSLFVVHKRVPENQRQKLIASILEWPNTVEGRKLFEGGKIVPMVRAENSAYDVIRK